MEPFLGLIQPMGFNFAPRGWMLCQGQLMSISQNTALFSLLGTTFGGDGQTTFALPDLRGRAILGAGTGPGLSPVDLGEVAGSYSTTVLISNLPTHTHVVTAKGNGLSSNSSDPNNSYFGGGSNIYDSAWDNSSVMNAACITAAITGGSQPLDVTNPYLAMNYNIATEGIYPSRN